MKYTTFTFLSGRLPQKTPLKGYGFLISWCYLCEVTFLAKASHNPIFSVMLPSTKILLQPYETPNIPMNKPEAFLGYKLTIKKNLDRKFYFN